MFTTPKKKSGGLVAEGKTANGDPSGNGTIVFENGTILGAVSGSPTSAAAKRLVIPEIVISASYSSNSLHRSRCDVGPQQAPSANGGDDHAIESTALLEQPSDADQPAHDEFEQFVLNRTTSDSNILESSVYSELQFASSAVDGGVSGGSTGQVPAPQQPSSGADVLNSSVCSRDSRQGKRTRRKHKSKSKCSVVSASGQRAAGATVVGATYPPQYTAIFLDHHHGGGAANAMGQIASAAASSPFIGAPLSGPADAGFLHHQQYQFYQQRPMLSSLGAMGHLHHHHRPLLEGDVPQSAIFGAPDGSIGAGATPAGVAGAAGAAGSAITITAPTSTITPPLRASFRKWFSRPSLPFVIGILALGGVACTLGGIVLGSTGLIEHSTQYLSAALLMIGIGVSLLVISGAIWRLSIPDDVDECPCYRHMETCRNCNSPYCNNRLLPGSYLYPEFQHRPPPPSYLTSLNECAAMGLLFHPGAQPQQPYSTLRMNTPPPLYRSTNSLSVYPSAGSTASQGVPSTAAPHSTMATSGGILPDHSALTMSVVMENLQAQTQPLTKEIHYLELD